MGVGEGEELAVRGVALTKVYDVGETQVRALDSVDLTIPRGQFLSIMGPSGSGKSTLLNLIGCIDTPTSGSLHVLGREVSRLPERELCRVRLRDVGFIFQQFFLITTLRAFENVELPMKEARVPRSRRHARVNELLGMVGLDNRSRHFPSQLSGGEQQRVAIARALANEPRILLADEPTGEVDSHTSDTIMDILEELNREQGLTLIVVSHDPGVAGRARRRLHMVDGRITSDRHGPLDRPHADRPSADDGGGD